MNHLAAGLLSPDSHFSDAADLVRTIMKAVKYVHECGIVHRGASTFVCWALIVKRGREIDLKPENLLFRTPAEDADIMVADFGLSRIMDDQKLTMLTEVCGTPGVRPPFFLLFMQLILFFY
jgi:calcium/calmodulin-dependent protein kinase I